MAKEEAKKEGEAAAGVDAGKGDADKAPAKPKPFGIDGTRLIRCPRAAC